MRVDQWTEIELNLLRKKYAILDSFHLKKIFPNRTYQAIKVKANAIGLKKGSGNHGRKYWSKEEIEELSKIYPNISNPKLAELFKCSIDSITHAANKYKFKKTLEYKRNMVSPKFLAAGRKTRFNPGNVSFNKGKKWDDYMTKEAQEKSAKTHFIKGRIPHNYVLVGHERKTVDGYIEVKVRDLYGDNSVMNFELKHRLIWVKNFGPIPKNCNVSFKDGDKENLELSNLLLLTKEENLFKNIISDSSICKRFLGVTSKNEIQYLIENYSELIELKRNQIKLNKKIKDHAKTN